MLRLAARAGAELGHLVPVVALERQGGELGEAERMDLGCEDRGVPRALREPPRRRFALSQEMVGDALQEAGERVSGAAGGAQQLAGRARVVAHPGGPSGGRRGAHERDARLDLAGRSGELRRVRGRRGPPVHQVTLAAGQLAPGRDQREPRAARDLATR